MGTTTTSIPVSAIQEFHVSQSTLDISTELTSSGSVNVATKSGTNSVHGQAFGAFRDSSFSSELPAPPGFKTPFQRSEYGGAVGGAIIKDKAFFFADGERTLQHTQVPVLVAAPFAQYSGTFADPFHEENLLGRLDYHLSPTARVFYRFSYFKNSSSSTSGVGYSLYDNVNITRNHVVGVDFDRWNLANSIRFSFLKFENQMVDATIGNIALPFNDLHAEIAMGATGLVAGPNFLAPKVLPKGIMRSNTTAAACGKPTRFVSALRTTTSSEVASRPFTRTGRRSLRRFPGRNHRCRQRTISGRNFQSLQLPGGFRRPGQRTRVLDDEVRPGLSRRSIRPRQPHTLVSR